MPTRSATQAASPLDTFLARFLECLAARPDGFGPIVDGPTVAQQLEVLPAFVDALFVSARTRGLIEPFRAKSARGRYRWQVSNRGRVWLTGRAAAPATAVSPVQPTGAGRPVAGDSGV
jgi:hypothetical protein